ARLAPALTSFITSDAFLRNLISAAAGKADELRQPPAGRQTDAETSRQPTAATSGCQSQPGPSFPRPAAVQPQANAGAAADPGATPIQQAPRQSSATEPQPEPTFKAHEVKALLKALQGSATERPTKERRKKEREGDSDSDSTPPAKKRAATKKAKKTWATPTYKDPAQCSWRNQDSVNRHRYGALVDITTKLRAFRAAYVGEDVEQSAYDDYNSMVKVLQREMEIILAADASEHGWGLIREMHNQPETVDPLLQGTLTKADDALKRRAKEGRGGRPPFRGGRGGSAAAKTTAAYPHLQLPGGGAGQLAGAGQQQSIRFADGAVPTAYTTMYPRFQGAGLRCFLCQQPGHFQKACPLGNRAKQDPGAK
ncbi:MAG: hypothetical protein GY835_18370, partial [bacterium]|nr:hypothetical protein [bacterium]